MERIPIAQTIRTTRLLLATLGIFHCVFNIIGFLSDENFRTGLVQGDLQVLDYIYLLEYFGALAAGIILFLKKNWGVLLLFFSIVIDFFLVSILGVFIPIIFDIVVIVLSVQYLLRLRKYRRELDAPVDRGNETLTLN